MTASIIIPTLNREQSLINTIRFALGQQYDDYEVIVVDQTNTHSIETTQALSELIKDSRLQIIHETIKSLPNARNVGIKAAKGEYLVFIDDDVELDKDFLANHVHFMQKYKAEAVGGRILQKDKPIVSSPVTIDAFGRVFGDGLSGELVREMDSFRGCNMAFHRTIFKQCGLFDIHYTGSAVREESDLAMRIKKRGLPILFNPVAQLVHLEDGSGGCNVDQPMISVPRDERSENYKNDTFFFLKHRHHWLFPIYVIGTYKAFVFKPRFMTGSRFLKQVGVVSRGLWAGFWLYWSLRSQGELLD